MADAEIILLVTSAVRAADQEFEIIGGSSRHWVRDCLLPELERHGLAVVRLTPASTRPPGMADQLSSDVNPAAGDANR